MDLDRWWTDQRGLQPGIGPSLQGSHWGETADSGVAIRMPKAPLLRWVPGRVEVEVLQMICIEPLQPIPGCRTIEGVDPHCGYGGSMTNVFTPRVASCVCSNPALGGFSNQPLNTWQALLRTNLSHTFFICPNFIYHRHSMLAAHEHEINVWVSGWV